MRIAIVTFEFEGVTKNGGIGTAFRRMGDLLLAAGHSVTVVLMPFKKEAAGKIAALRRRGFEIVTPDLPGKVDADLEEMSFHLRRSLLVYRYLKDNRFDVVHASDNCALVYFSLLAKKQGLAFERTVFVVGAHGSTLWTQEANHAYSVDGFALAELDRRSVGMADLLVSPSQYMVGDLRKKNWPLPRSVKMIPNVNHLDRIAKPSARLRAKAAAIYPKKLVFFGRLERRKGIFLFLDAVCGLLDADSQLGARKPLEIVFLGKDERPLGKLETRHYIRERLGRYGRRVSCRFMPDCSSEEGLAFLSASESCLVCMPSLVDNSPYVVLEAIERGLDFISSNAGGQAELIHPKDRAAVLFSPTQKSLEAALRKRLSARRIKVRPSPSAASANRKWLELHDHLRAKAKSTRIKPRPAAAPEVSIVVGRGLDYGWVPGNIFALNAVFRQDYPNLTICVPEDRLTLLSSGRHRVVRYPSPLARDCRELVLKATRGKYVLFLEEGELYDAGVISRLVDAAECLNDCRAPAGVVGLEGARATRAGDQRICWSALHVCHGWVGALTERIQPRFALWRRSELIRHLDSERGGWNAQSGTLFSRLVVAGKHVELLPEPTVVARAGVSHARPQDPLRRLKQLLRRQGKTSQWEKVLLVLATASEKDRAHQLERWSRYKK